MMHVDEQGTAQIIPKTNKKWKEEIKYCPACYQNCIQTQLKLYQINMYEAVYLCPNYLNCLYPQADGWYFINRSIDEMVSDTESDDGNDEEHPKPDIQDEVENLIQKMQSEFRQTNNDNTILNSILSKTQIKKETSMSMLFSEMDSRLAHIEEKVVENINENNRILLETEDKSNYIDNDLLNDLDYLLNGCNENEASPPEGIELNAPNPTKYR